MHRVAKIIFLSAFLPLGNNVVVWCLMNNNVVKNEPFITSRRGAFSQFAKKVLVGTATISPVVILSVSEEDDVVQAACLPGDASPECIGVYKLPLQDAINSPTVNSKESLQRNAPGVKYVEPTQPPDSVLQAKEQLLAQRIAADDIVSVVQAGKLQEAGIKVLNLIPKVTGSGMVIQQQVQSTFSGGGSESSGINQMKVVKYQQQYQELIALWSQIDVEIGQALRGQRGVSAVAQIELLGSLKEATAAFDDFLLLVDADTK